MTRPDSGAPSTGGAADGARRPPLQRALIAKALPFQRWGIPARAAMVSASVVLLALSFVAASLLALLYFTLIRTIDDAAANRVHDIARALQTEGPQDLGSRLLAPNNHVALVQLVDDSGTVIARSSAASSAPAAAPGEFGPKLRRGVRAVPSADNDLRMSGQRVQTPTGAYTVIVGGTVEDVESTVEPAALVLAVATPAIAAVAALVSHRLVRRSLRSVEAIRSRVADISASGLSERVPVPPQHDEISALAETMNAMLARVQDGHRAQQQFVGDASHELRNPLTTIISALEVCIAHPQLLTTELATDTLLPEAQRMRALVEDLLLLARADERGLDRGGAHVLLDEIAGVEAARARRHTSTPIRVTAAPTPVTADSAALARVVRNLLDNAARYASSRVDVSVRSRGPEAVLVVADDGPGIPEDDRARVFERFVRLGADRSRQAGGTGLGLAIVAEIVAAHGGTAAIADTPGGGTTITVVLPHDTSRAPDQGPA
ncbi:MAG: HAMP domain-containing sensor histidine kinase [Segniliparus sp.]|uniref:sensor histidine kinase n=1 Tax=Segniliparus sp. TaxID=2804064 RepID=UPI003F3CF877